MLAEAGDPELTIALYTLQQLLIGTPASPLRKALIESGLGEDLTGRGLDSGLLQMMFSTGLKGVKPEDTDAVEKLVLDTLQQLAEGGIDPQDIAAALNTVEFNLREQNTGAYPRGLVNMINALETWLYERPPRPAGLRKTPAGPQGPPGPRRAGLRNPDPRSLPQQPPPRRCGPASRPEGR